MSINTTYKLRLSNLKSIGASNELPPKTLHHVDNSVDAEALIQEGADVNKVNIRGYTPLQVACINGYIEVARVLLDHGAEFSSPIDPRLPSALQLACDPKNIPLILLLIKKGADINPLLFNPEHAQLLIAPDILNQKDTEGNTPLHKACLYGKSRVIEILLDAGADVKSINNKKEIPLHLVINPDCVNLLMGHIFDINAKDQDGNTPLHKACLAGRVEVVKMLLLSGVNRSLTNNKGQTPLDLVSMEKEKAMRSLVALLRDDQANFYEPIKKSLIDVSEID